jgi:AbrB family looped-hinge helix DNA binding protein
LSELIRVRKKSQLTLPPSVRKSLGIEEGDYLDIRVREGEIVLKLKRLIDKNQSWFWTNRWQQGEKEADEDIKAGRVQHFPDANEAVSFLKKQTGTKSRKTK